ncbi:hypothetical protein ACFWU3_12655 [Streptomyces sp. NPDC058685]|uniref:hypothetical protein n=1 Tax=Streptomyces sp. NPDC058685 TaxID=3346598 RepID=UPI003667BE2D
MGDEKKPELTPQDHEKKQAETASQIEGQFGATDALERFATVMDKIGFGNPGGLFGKTSFEEVQLNAMLDLLEASNPSDLERAGENLEKARVALNKAAKDLDDFVKKTDWKGEGATEFQRYGSELAGYAWKLGAFANVVGTQMTVASTGLTSVKNSMPRERDTRLIAKKPEAFALAPAKDTNPEYIEAVKVEKNRQEAINQMNRLSSFYAVSEQSLAQQQPPEMPKMLKAAVPRPSASWRGTQESASESGSPGEANRVSGVQQVGETVPQDTSRTESGGLAKPTPTPTPTPSTSVEIDSVTTPTAPTTAPSSTPPQSATSTGPPASGQLPPMTAGFSSPVKGGTARATGTSGVSRAGGGGPAAGRAGTSGSGGTPAGRAGATGAAGRPGAVGGGTPAGRAGATGAAGRPGAVGGGTPAGRAGAAGAAGRPGAVGAGGSAGRSGAAGNTTQRPVAGRAAGAGQPVVGRPGSGGSTGPGAGRSNGIVGGTPQRTGGSTPGARIPRGTVIGSEGAAPGRPANARPSQSGVIGSGPAQGAARPSGRGTPSSNGIVGAPRAAGAGGSKPGSGGFTRGGAGLSGGRAGQRQANDEDPEESGSSRPDHLTADEETRTVGRRGAVPPVID